MTGIPEIKHVVVLMFENRSFDHLFGAFPGANGLFEYGKVKPGIYNLADPTQKQGPSNKTFLPVAITPEIPLDHDFDHNFGNGMMQELFGPGTTGVQNGKPLNAPPTTHPPTNCGFVSTIAYNVDGHPVSGPQEMSYFEHGSLKVLHQLASQFVLCDNWFCDMPGDTLLNRFFIHTAQTDGWLTDDQSVTIGVRTIFDQVEAQNRSWKMYVPLAEKDGVIVYNEQVDSRFIAPNIKNSPNTKRPITEFAADAAQGKLPFYSFLMRWLPLTDKISTTSTDTSMHPNSDIRPGENYLAAVYKTLRNSPCWNDTLLIVTFDENGGLYDHVAPPATKAPNSKTGSEYDQYLGAECTFDFTLLGPRIPALLVSPWLRPGIATHQFQNTSVLRLIEDLIGSPCLNARDGNAPKLDCIFDDFGLPQPRTDCPASFPGYPGFPYADGDLGKIYVVPPGAKGAAPRYMAHLARIYGIAE